MATLVLNYAGQRLTVEYPAERLNGEQLCWLFAALVADRPVELAETLADLLVRWDLTETEGSPSTRPTVDALLQLPVPLLTRLAWALHERYQREAGEE